MAVKGLPFIGKLNEFLDRVIHATISKVGSSKAALDVVNRGYALLSDPIAKVTIEAGSTDGLVVVTAHSFKVGDMLKMAVTANPIDEEFAIVDEIIDANSIKLAGYLSADLSAGDTIDHFRPVIERLAADGSSMATFVAPPIRFERVNGGVTTEQVVRKDLDTPANTHALPVVLYGVNGTLAVTTDTLDINLTHAGPQGDSIAIGNGNAVTPRLWDIDSVNGAGLVRAVDLDIRAINPTDDGISLYDGLNKLAINLAGEAAINKAGLSTEAKQDAAITAIGLTTTAVSGMHADLGDNGDAAVTDHTLGGTLIAFMKGAVSWLSSIRTRLDSPLASAQSGVWSVAVNNHITGFATEGKQDSGNTLLSSIDTNTTNLEDRLDTLIVALTALNAKLPVIGQQLSAASQSIVLSSNHPALNTVEARNTLGSSTHVILNNSASFFTAPADAVGFVLKNQSVSDEAVFWALGAAASTGDQDLLPAQGTAFIPFGGNVHVLSTGIATVAIAWVRR